MMVQYDKLRKHTVNHTVTTESIKQRGMAIANTEDKMES